MANFILPNEYFFRNLNDHLVFLAEKSPELIKKNVNFMGIEANLPFSIWNGGTLINDKFMDSKQIEDLYSAIPKPLVIDCSNIFISSNDIFNLKENIFLEKYHTGLNYIIISDPNFLTLLKCKYPYYSFILSPYLPKEEITDELINSCSYVINYYNDINTKIPKNKLIIMFPINQKCYECTKFLNCSKKEQENIYSFKTISQFRTCPSNSNNDIFSLNYNKLVQEGYINFIFDDRAFSFKNQSLMCHFYASLFGVKDKDQELFNLLMEG